MSFNIEVAGGTTIRLPTAGKYCDRDIVIAALGTGGTLAEEMDINFYDDDGTLLYSGTVELEIKNGVLYLRKKAIPDYDETTAFLLDADGFYLKTADDRYLAVENV